MNKQTDRYWIDFWFEQNFKKDEAARITAKKGGTAQRTCGKCSGKSLNAVQPARGGRLLFQPSGIATESKTELDLAQTCQKAAQTRQTRYVYLQW